MTRVFSVERKENRKELLEAVEEVRETLESHAEESEANRTLAQESVDALYQSGLFRLKLPAVLSGAEADPVTQMDIIEAVTRIHPSAGWCLMIGSTSVALPAAFLPEPAVQQVFDGGHVPKVATAFMPSGRVTLADGGYVLSGRWAFASGVLHSQWLNAGALVALDGETPEHYFLSFPTEKAQIHDNWRVLGLQGTGSCDFSVSELFVPQEFAWNSHTAPPQRGGPLYHMGIPAFFANEHVAFALGVARRTLDTIIGVAGTRRRGFTPSPSLLASRTTFQRDLGECDLKLQAARALAVEVFEEAWDTVCAGDTLSPQLQAKTRSAATYATDVAVEVVSTAFRYSGGSAVFLSSTLQRCLRDIETAAQHLLVSSSAYENHGQFMLGLPDANPMA